MFTEAPFTGKYCNARTNNFAIILTENNGQKVLLNNISLLSKDQLRDQFFNYKVNERKEIGGK